MRQQLPEAASLAEARKALRRPEMSQPLNTIFLTLNRGSTTGRCRQLRHHHHGYSTASSSGRGDQL
ncbi:MAG: hypothetical protein ACLSA6_15845 [Holdemania massiliensis]